MHFPNSEYSRLSNSDKALYEKLLDAVTRLRPTVPVAGAEFDRVFHIYTCVLQDHPEIFWLRQGAKATFVRNGKAQIMLFVPKPVEGLAMERVPRMREVLDRIAESVANRAAGLKTNYEKVLFVHDHIISHTQYVHSPCCHNAYGCLIENKAVCDGYSSAFQLILQKLGIPCGIVFGEDLVKNTGRDTHAWNYCLLDDGLFYFVDVTWDDPVYQNDIKKHRTYEYFCVSGRDLERTHRISREYYVPQCSSNKYNYYVFHGLYVGFYRFETVYPVISAQVLHNRSVSIKFVNREETEKAVRDLIEQHRVFSIPGVEGPITYWVSKSKLILTIELKSKDSPRRALKIVSKD